MNEIQLGDRIKMAHTLEVKSATKRKLELKISWYDVHGKNHISWYDVHGKNHTGQYSIDEGSKIEL